MTRTPYVPPAFDSDEPLTEIEQALVRALSKLFARQIRESLQHVGNGDHTTPNENGDHRPGVLDNDVQHIR